MSHKDKVKEVENSAGDTSIYIIKEGKPTITIGMGAITQSKMSALLSAIDSPVITVSYMDNDGAVKTGNFKRGDINNALKSYINSNPFWDETEITLTGL